MDRAARAVQARRRRRRRRRALRLLLASCAVAALFLFLRSDLFLVRNLTISGLQRLTPAEVQAHTGLARQTLVWQVWPWRVERRLLTHPRVAAARVSITLPNRVRITVTERQPVAVFLSGGGSYVEVEAQGRILAVWPRPVVPAAPLVTGITLPAPRPGQRLTEAGARRVLRVAAGLGPAGRARVSEIHLDAGGEVRLFTLEGVPVYLGVDEAWEDKGRVLLAALAAVGDARQLAYIDLRSVRRPVIRMKETPAADRGTQPPSETGPEVGLP